MLPLLAIAMLLVAQVGLLVAEQLAVQHAAREGARVAAVTNDDDAACEAAVAAGGLASERASVVVEPGARDVGDPVRVTVTYQPTIMPVVARFVPSSIRLRASVVMRTESAP